MPHPPVNDEANEFSPAAANRIVPGKTFPNKEDPQDLPPVG